MSALYEKSIELLLKYQDPSGAYLASPNFLAYRYAWLRDGSFCAHALAQAGETESALRFHAWVLGVLKRYRAKLERCIQAARQGSPLPARRCLHSRFTVEGREVPGNWGHHQLDGLGAWLWAYAAFTSEVAPADRPLLMLVRDYLAALWRFPCSDCWEEHEDQLHPNSLAAVCAGLQALGVLLDDDSARRAAEEIRQFILEQAVCDGRIVKSLGNPAVDASLLSLAVPYGVLAPDDPRMAATVAEIERSLRANAAGVHACGVHRYAADTYYGGGEWLLLTAWLGWYYAVLADAHGASGLVGRPSLAAGAGAPETLGKDAQPTEKIAAILAWIEAQAGADGSLPEQVPAHLNHPAGFPYWVEKWGPIASPLLWSHAQYMILRQVVERAKSQP